MLSSEFERFQRRLRDHQIDIWADHVRAATAGVPAERARMTALAVVCLLEYFLLRPVHRRRWRGRG